MMRTQAFNTLSASTEFNNTTNKTKTDSNQTMQDFFALIKEQSASLLKDTSDADDLKQPEDSFSLLLDQKSMEEISKMSKEDSIAYLNAKGQEMKDKLMHGETEEKFKIGANEFTNSDWKKLIRQIDKIVDNIKENKKEELKKRDQQEEKKELLDKMKQDEAVKNLYEEELAAQKLISL